MNNQIIEKIKKLMALSTSDNPHEAALAFSTAQRLLDTHKLSLTDVENSNGNGYSSSKESIAINTNPLYVGKNSILWKDTLASNIAKLNSCRVFVQWGYNFNGRTSKLQVVGCSSDVEIVRYMFNSIVAQIELMAANALKNGVITGKTGSNNYRLGMINTIISRLKSAQEEVRKEYQGSLALVLVKNHDAEVAKFVEDNLKLKSKPNNKMNWDNSGYSAGKEAGHKVSLNKGMSGGNNVTKALS